MKKLPKKKRTCAQAQVACLREIQALIAEGTRDRHHDRIVLLRIAVALETIAAKTEGPEA